MINGWDLLIEAIVEQAMGDYDRALRKHDEGRIKECEMFFESEWFEFLVDLDGKTIRDIVRRRVEDESKKCFHKKSPK